MPDPSSTSLQQDLSPPGEESILRRSSPPLLLSPSETFNLKELKESRTRRSHHDHELSVSSGGQPRVGLFTPLPSAAFSIATEVDESAQLKKKKTRRQKQGKGKEAPSDEQKQGMATVGQMFAFNKSKRRTRLCLIFGMLCSAMAGLVYPGAAFAVAQVFSTITTDPTSPGYLDNLALNAYIFIGLGVWSFIFMGSSSFLLETAAKDMAFQLSSDWFAALLRQDMAYHDLVNVSGAASLIASNTAKYARGVGRKMGEGIIFTVALLGGFGYALYSSWQVTLVVIGVLPIMALTSMVFSRLGKEQDAFADKNYAGAGSIVYTTVLCIRTVLALNAVENMIVQFKDATERAYKSARDRGWVLGLASGSSMAAFQFSYLILTLFGSFLVYDQVRKTGCDPSGSALDTNEGNTCDPSGQNIFGAFLGMSMAGTGIPLISGSMELFTKGRTAIYPAICCMNRKLDTTSDDNADGDDNDGAAKKGQKQDDDIETGKKKLKLPKYSIDSSSPDGLKPKEIVGDIEFKNVRFTYPARPDKPVLTDFNLTIKAGQTVALVGPSGGGKSTIVALLERFYDPEHGSVTVDGIDIQDFNLKYLRKWIGLVQQEPTLFAATIAENIRYGKLDGTREDIEKAAIMANAHGFIETFPDGYDTNIGSAQLSGGQKQRVCIARTLMKQPSILLLDEATSALDSESELIVQRALDDLLEKSSRTTIVIAHRLSTIRNADMIAFVKDGKVMETGTHSELMEKEDGYYRKLVETGQMDPSSPKEVDSADAKAQETEETETPTEEQPLTTYGEKDLALQLNFRSVDFAYPNRPNNVIFEGLNLAVRSGETVALVGPSGGGKSTIVALLERFYDPVGGSVELLGSDLKDINVRYLRDQIGLVEQEPTLFAMSIADNIAYGFPGASREEIIEAAKSANAHDFISSFPDRYDTDVGQRGSQLSGGQKQRIAIARAVLKKPKIMLLDEATSALDSESQSVVQEALDQLANSSNQTTLIIAHRLSTIRKANRVAYIAGGQVQEIGTFDELMAKPAGRFKRLFELQNMRASEYLTALKEKANELENLDEEEDDETAATSGDDEDEPINAADSDDSEDKQKEPKHSAWRFISREDSVFLFLGSLGALVTGLVFPAWGVMFAFTIDLLYRSVLSCSDTDPPTGYVTCQDYYDAMASDMQQTSFYLTYAWIGIIAITLLGNTLLFYGFQAASEKMVKRVRDTAFEALVRQEVGYFDTRNVGDIVTQMQEDASLLQAYTGEPIRLVLMSSASLLVSVLLAFALMWPFALMVLAVLPFMSISHILSGKLEVEGDEEDIDDDDGEDESFGPGSIALESMTYIRTVASLTLEGDRHKMYTAALKKYNKSSLKRSALVGMNYGLGQLLQQCGSALIFWWGGWLLVNYSTTFNSTDFLISYSGLLLSLNSLNLAAYGMTNKSEAQSAVTRLADLIDRESSIDPLSEEGKKDL